MSEETKQELSALVDGEILHGQAPQILGKLCKDRSLQQCWAQYHLIRDALHNTLPDVNDWDLPARVQKALEPEPVFLPARRKAGVGVRPLVGLGLAASVAAVVIVLFGMLGSSPDSGGRDSLTAQSDGSRFTAPVAATTPRPTWNRMRWNVEQPAVEARLNSYLVDHSEYLDNGMRGILPYARVVGYDAGQ